MEIKPATRTENIRYAIRDVVVEADRLKKQGANILHLNIGNPNAFDFTTPEWMSEAVFKAIRDNKNGYADSLGIPEARQAILEEAGRKGIKNVTDEDIVVGTGVSEVIEMCLSALVNPGENFIIPNPGYPLYNALVSKLDTTLNKYTLDEEKNWEPDMDELRKKINDKTRAIIIINPNNPTGSLYSKKVLEEIIDLANEHNMVIFSDEIYDKILYDGETHTSTASLADDVPVLTLNGLAKNYLVPGWRVGWAVFSGNRKKLENYKEAVFKLARARLSTTHPFQFAIKPALSSPKTYFDDLIQKLTPRRDLTYKRLNEIEGMSVNKPKGAFYAFPKFDFKVEDDMKLIMDILHKKHVLMVPGSGFGWDKPDHFRIVFLPQLEVLSESYNKLEEYIKENVNRT
ncbi:aminotransferase class I/II-fold pyridoxal phosphate-dependent enzyme [Candidatus Aenigmatarchaeota archaeon]